MCALNLQWQLKLKVQVQIYLKVKITAYALNCLFVLLFFLLNLDIFFLQQTTFSGLKKRKSLFSNTFTIFRYINDYSYFFSVFQTNHFTCPRCPYSNVKTWQMPFQRQPDCACENSLPLIESNRQFSRRCGRFIDDFTTRHPFLCFQRLPSRVKSNHLYTYRLILLIMLPSLSYSASNFFCSSNKVCW